MIKWWYDPARIAKEYVALPCSMRFTLLIGASLHIAGMQENCRRGRRSASSRSTSTTQTATMRPPRSGSANA